MLQFILTLTDESNQSKIEQIFKKHYGYMMRYATSRFRREGRVDYALDAEDAVQNTFMKITKYINGIDFSLGEKEVKSYCLTILSNEISNILKEKEIFFENFEEFRLENEYNYIEGLELREKYDEVVEAIANLDERYSTTLYFAFCKEMSVKEIAEIMGVSPKTVYTRIARGKKQLLCSLKREDYYG